MKNMLSKRPPQESCNQGINKRLKPPVTTTIKTSFVRSLERPDDEGKRIATVKESVMDAAKKLYSESSGFVAVNDLDATVLPLDASHALEITEVIVHLVPNAASSTPFQCAGCIELRGQVENLQAQIETGQAQIETGQAQIENLQAQIETGQAMKTIKKILLCLVEIDGLSSKLTKQSSQDLLSDMRNDRNGIAHFIRYNDDAVVTRFKLDLLRKEVAAIEVGSLKYNLITDTYGTEEIEDLFRSLLELLNERLESNSNSSSTMPTVKQKKLAEMWWKYAD